MQLVKFKYSLTKDALNWSFRIGVENGKPQINKKIIEYYPPDLLQKIQNADNYKEINNLIKTYFEKSPNYKEKIKIIKTEIKAIESVWRRREKAFFEALEKIIKKPIYCEKFTGFFTTFAKCPYSEKDNWFMVNFWAGIPEQLTNIAHEIMHLQFLHYYRPALKQKKLSEEKIQILKEAITFLLNERFFYTILFTPDRGYKEHSDLRNKLKKIWSETKDFDLFIEKSIPLL